MPQKHPCLAASTLSRWSSKKSQNHCEGGFELDQEAVSNVGVDVCIAKLISTLYNEAKVELKHDGIYNDYVS